jgi:hypothetical protein
MWLDPCRFTSGRTIVGIGRWNSGRTGLNGHRRANLHVAVVRYVREPAAIVERSKNGALAPRRKKKGRRSYDDKLKTLCPSSGGSDGYGY